VGDDDTGVGPDDDDDLPGGLHCQCRADGARPSPGAALALVAAWMLGWRRRR